jgi:hypothetical protein
MIKARYSLLLTSAFLVTLMSTFVQADKGGRRDNNLGTAVYSQNAYKVPYLGLDGVFTVDTKELSASDPRNPPRVVFEKMEYFSYYADSAGKMPIAQQCRYIYRGAVGDNYYYPDIAKTSIWDMFELASGEAACNEFYYVLVRPPHGNPIHMHLRHGDQYSSFKKLLKMSNGPEDKTKLDPWWSVYCAEGVSGCD